MASMVTELGVWNVYRGDTFYAELTLWEDAGKTIPWDLVGAELMAEVRIGTGKPVLATFDCELITDPNVVSMTLTPASTLLLPPTGADPLWDLQATWPAATPIVHTLVRGTVHVEGDITDSGTIPLAVRRGT